MGFGVDSQLDSGDTAWMLVATALVFFMTPGLALFYGGLVRTKHALNIVMQNIVACGLMTIQWFVIGYTLCFSEGNAIYGNLSRMFFSKTYLGTGHPLAPTIPESLFCMYQLMFAIITPALITGATADRFKFKTYCVFIIVWGTLVYDPICHQVWHPDGWLNKMGVLDFAGGVVVHACAATSALVACLVLGKRREYEPYVAAHSPFLVILGTGMLWFGWFGFNAGSALAANSQAVNAFVSSQVAAAFAGITWTALEMIFVYKPTATGLCVGYVAGLATITPPAGFIAPLPAMGIGVLAAIMGFSAIRLRVKLGYDDALDVFAVHGLASSGGVLLTAIFADSQITGMVFPAGHAALDLSQQGGWLNHNYRQLGIQLLGLVICMLWSAIGTFIIMKILDYIPYLGLRVTVEDEMNGMDWAMHHELLYGNTHSSMIVEESLIPEIGENRHIHAQSAANVHTVNHKTSVHLNLHRHGSIPPATARSSDKDSKSSTTPNASTSHHEQGTEMTNIVIPTHVTSPTIPPSPSSCHGLTISDDPTDTTIPPSTMESVVIDPISV